MPRNPVARPFDAYDHATGLFRTHDKGGLATEPPHSEVIAPDKFFAENRLNLFHHGFHRTNFALLEIDASHGLIDLQRPWLACLRIDVIPVEEPERDVAVFLNFKDHDVAQRMDGSARMKTVSPSRGKLATGRRLFRW